MISSATGTLSAHGKFAGKAGVPCTKTSGSVQQAKMIIARDSASMHCRTEVCQNAPSICPQHCRWPQLESCHPLPPARTAFVIMKQMRSRSNAFNLKAADPSCGASDPRQIDERFKEFHRKQTCWSELFATQMRLSMLVSTPGSLQLPR